MSPRPSVCVLPVVRGLQAIIQLTELAHAFSQHFGPNIGIAVVDNLFGLMQGSKAIVLANQKLWWMTAAAKYR